MISLFKSQLSNGPLKKAQRKAMENIHKTSPASCSLSVIIPTYKPGSYIFQILDNLQHQTLRSDFFEVIIVLNGEREPYFSQIRDHVRSLRNEPAIRLLYSTIAGVSAARNLGIEQAIGDYIAFIDDDDRITNNYLEQLLANAKPDTIVCSNVIALDDTVGNVLPHFMTSAYSKMRTKNRLSLWDSRSLFSGACCKLIPKQAIGKRRFRADFSLGEDALFMFEISDSVKNIVLTAPDAIYYVMIRQTSVSHQYYSYPTRLRLAMRTTLAYNRIYLKNLFAYNFPFWASRIAATILKLHKRHYE